MLNESVLVLGVGGVLGVVGLALLLLAKICSTSSSVGNDVESSAPPSASPSKQPSAPPEPAATPGIPCSCNYAPHIKCYHYYYVT
ncbi:hypothetical protein GOP47_0016581 [Adiantum capillus-veneris]|uniref:Uncharacterized protein n=1 Tax=Adiantum capillus-veneris TaxID=13818 RepID=A0A9D4UIY7_ADICA|nr:hypothetical protein GOP47_0016581 [Adiantum capillus-veneris]